MDDSLIDVIDLYDDLDPVGPPKPVLKKRGRPARSIKNPLNNIPPSSFLNDEGRPQVWLDDILMGSIRVLGERDKRETTTSLYVSLSKVVKVLSNLKGDLTSPRIQKALGVSRDTAWRILSVIDFATFPIERALRSDSRIIEYRPPGRLKYSVPKDSFKIPERPLRLNHEQEMSGAP